MMKRKKRRNAIGDNIDDRRRDTADIFDVQFDEKEKQADFYKMVTAKHPFEEYRLYIEKYCKGFIFIKIFGIYSLNNHRAETWLLSRILAILLASVLVYSIFVFLANYYSSWKMKQRRKAMETVINYMKIFYEKA
jgi:hypothetical protein